MALKKLCCKLGCNNVIDVGERYCPEHQFLAGQKDTRRHKLYDAQKRNREARDFYHSAAWEQVREYVLARHKGLDLYAFFVHKTITPATTVHHIVELGEDWGLRLDAANLFPVSDGNHNVIHHLYKRDRPGTQEMLRGLLQEWQERYGK